jgi:hypothetical protein
MLRCSAQRDDMRVVPQGDGIQLPTAYNRDRHEAHHPPCLYRVVVKHRRAGSDLLPRGEHGIEPNLVWPGGIRIFSG